MKILPNKFFKKLTKPCKIQHIFSGGFTLLEMIMVMAIIGILATFFIGNFKNSLIKARDVNRKSDLRQLVIATETYANNHQGFYPGESASTGIRIKCSGHICSVFFLCDMLGITGCPLDPKDSQTVCYNDHECAYFYTSNCATDSSPCATSFVIRGRLEAEAGHFVFCSNGKSGIVSEGTDFSNNKGLCPL
jgi:prepilin-type N-terminal cleavage/methylation domain-containing protein